MKSVPDKMLSVVLENGGWYVEPLNSHLYLHIARDAASGQVYLVTTTSPDAETARLTAAEDDLIATISLYDLLEINRKAESRFRSADAQRQPGV